MGKPNFCCKQWMVNKGNSNTTFKCERKSSPRDSLGLVTMTEISARKKERKEVEKLYFHPFLVMALKPFLYGGLCIPLRLKFGKVSPCLITNLLEISKQKITEYAQNYLQEVRMLVKNIYNFFTKMSSK